MRKKKSDAGVKLVQVENAFGQKSYDLSVDGKVVLNYFPEKSSVLVERNVETVYYAGLFVNGQKEASYLSTLRDAADRLKSAFEILNRKEE